MSLPGTIGDQSPGQSAAQRDRMGRAARRAVPRSSHRDIAAADRDAVALLTAQDVDRVPELLPLRYGRMAVSPFAFFRGAAAVMAADLASTPRSGLSVQLCGDAHLSNFGLFASPERQLVFDLNDFDETLPGPWEWDLKRLATSLEVAARDRGVGTRRRRRIVLAGVAAYREAMRAFAGRGALEVWHSQLPADRLLAQRAATLDATTRRAARASLRRARTRDHLRAADRLVVRRAGRLAFAEDPPLLVPLRSLLGGAEAASTLDRVRGAMAQYRASLSGDRRRLLDKFRIVDVARKVVGVGSVGTRAWVVLLVGRDETDPLLLQVKEAGPSVLEAHLGPGRYRNAGQRVVAGQRLMQAAGDILLGWQRFAGADGRPRDFYVRQLHDWKGGADVAVLSPTALTAYGELCGWTLARAHARSGDRIAIAAYLGRSTVFDDALADLAVTLADRNDTDHAALRAAISDGRVRAVTP